MGHGLTAVAQETWEQRRRRLFEERLKARNRDGLLIKFFGLPAVAEATADWLVDADDDVCIRVAEYLVEFPEEATRLCHLHPKEQRAALDRIANVTAPAKSS